MQTDPPELPFWIITPQKRGKLGYGARGLRCRSLWFEVSPMMDTIETGASVPLPDICTPFRPLSYTVSFSTVMWFAPLPIQMPEMELLKIWFEPE